MYTFVIGAISYKTKEKEIILNFHTIHTFSLNNDRENRFNLANNLRRLFGISAINCRDYMRVAHMRVLDLKAIRGTRTRLNVRERPCVSRPVGLVPYPVTTEETRVITSITHPDVCVFNLHLYFFFPPLFASRD